LAVPPPPSRAFKPNSVADIIRANTGKTYTVYQELFFRGIRPSIRNVLSLSRAGKTKIFDSRQNEAEEIIYNFLYEHYNNPYQNWKESEARKKVESLGYTFPEIETVIVRWIRDSEG
jgi:vacuolar-type H+-ATPase subunit B/Vma2